MHRTKILGALLLLSALGASQFSCVESEQQQATPRELPAPPTPLVELKPVATTMRRLLKRQYVNSVRTMFGPAAAAVAKPPDDSSVNGFDAIGARELSVSDSSVSAYEQSARDVAAAAMTNTARIKELAGCEPKNAIDLECSRSFVKQLGKLVFRRPLTEPEISRYVTIAQTAAQELDDWSEGAEHVISAFLQSPNFLYMVEVGDALDAEKSSLTDFELLTRMSYFLVDTTPDPLLIDLVEKEGLNSDQQIRYVAAAMLERLDARLALSNFYAELYRLRELDYIVKDKNIFPQYTPSLAESMKQETLKLLEDVVWDRDTDVREIFTADYTFVNAELAAFYGLKGPPGASFEKVSLPSDQARDGALGHAGFLSRFAHTATTSPTLRGKFVREKLLCQTIPPPPPDVITSLPDEDPMSEPKTMKERLVQHQKDPVCASCHKLMDTVGFAFENYDAIGAYRTLENGIPIDPSTESEGIGKFSSPKELGALLRDDPNVAMCMVRNLYTNALGHATTEGEEGSVNKIAFAFAESGFRVKQLLIEIVASPAFRIVGVPQ